MRNYTYIDGTRFIVANLFRSLRYDIDRLDMSWVGDQKPIFSRGFRIFDNDEAKLKNRSIHLAQKMSFMKNF